MTSMKSFWRKPWKVKVPSKVRNFGWKVCQNILPTKVNLFHRKIIEDATYKACGLYPESTMHALCQCNMAKEVWKQGNLLHLVEEREEFADLLWKIGLAPNTDSNILAVLIIAWGIWKNRNEVQHGGRLKIADALYASTIRLWEEYNAAQELPFKQGEEATPLIGWIPPPRGRYNVNSDGATFSKRRCSGIGVVIWDEQGRVVAAMSKNLQVPLGALEAKAKAVEEALIFSRDIGIQDIIVESDSMVVCSALQKKVDVSPAVDNVIAGTLL